MIALLVDLGIVLVLLAGIALFRSVRRARSGNLLAALAILAALVLILTRHPLSALTLVTACAAIGSFGGFSLARRVSMVGIPAMVALQNGLGGMASFLVAFVELGRGAGSGSHSGEIAALLGIVVGAGTLSGSLVAAGRLARWLAQKPTHIRHHSGVLLVLAGMAVLLMVLTAQVADPMAVTGLGVELIAVAAAMGIVLSIRVGGADMPVLISFLNAGSGIAAALCGLTIGNWLLIAAGAMVGVSGMILTQVMCLAMNRRLTAVLTGSSIGGPAAEPETPTVWPVGIGDPPRGDAAAPTLPCESVSSTPAGHDSSAEPSAAAVSVAPSTGAEAAAAALPAAHVDAFARTVELLRSARRVIIVPGYGMALADAQQEVASLAERLTGMGKEVLFAVHPVAGRMPGHMHVLLAEAEVDYGMIRELADVNPQFADTDLALVVGACDVVNPAAIDTPNTPISGMPILRVHEAASVVVCNLDDRPGYSGVENPLYRDPRTIMLLGDARETLARLNSALEAAASA